ncbi:MAG: hypothetical protein IH630_05885 [Thermoplasmata archaeon]|nr:hypothetical protein [Thermoplasmata archaeon]
MLAITHLAVSLLLIQLLSLDRNDSFVALMFGVVIDVDHLFGLNSYAKANGIASIFDFDSLMNADGQWKSLLHNPVSVMIVGPISVASRIAIPLIFWGVHISMDWLEDSLLGLLSAPELILVVCASGAVLWMRYSFFRSLNSNASFRRYIASEWRVLRRSAPEQRSMST